MEGIRCTEEAHASDRHGGDRSRLYAQPRHPQPVALLSAVPISNPELGGVAAAGPRFATLLAVIVGFTAVGSPLLGLLVVARILLLALGAAIDPNARLLWAVRHTRAAASGRWRGPRWHRTR